MASHPSKPLMDQQEREIRNREAYEIGEIGDRRLSCYTETV
jgi:hypothetical protein